MSIIFSFLLGIALAITIERLHYQPKAIRRAVEAVEDEATRNAARQFEIWKGVWLKDRTRKEDISDSLALAVYAMRENRTDKDEEENKKIYEADLNRPFNELGSPRWLRIAKATGQDIGRALRKNPPEIHVENLRPPMAQMVGRGIRKKPPEDRLKNSCEIFHTKEFSDRVESIHVYQIDIQFPGAFKP